MEKVNKDMGLNRQPATAERPTLSGENSVAIACAPPRSINIKDWSASRFCGRPAPKITWLVEDVLPLKRSAILAARHGVGKSMLTLDLAIKVASEPDFGGEQPMAFGHRVLTHGPVLILAAEDGYDELHRRAERLGGIYPNNVFVVPLLDLGGGQPFFVQCRSGTLEVTKAWRELVEKTMDVRPVLLNIDPLASFVMADMRKDYVGMWIHGHFRWLATASGACILMNHHLWGTEEHINSREKAENFVHGTSAIVNGADGCILLWDAEVKKAAAMCKLQDVPFRPGDVVDGCLVKSKYLGDNEVQVYARSGSGLLVPVVANGA